MVDIVDMVVVSKVRHTCYLLQRVPMRASLLQTASISSDAINVAVSKVRHIDSSIVCTTHEGEGIVVDMVP